MGHSVSPDVCGEAGARAERGLIPTAPVHSSGVGCGTALATLALAGETATAGSTSLLAGDLTIRPIYQAHTVERHGQLSSASGGQ
jgi:hypothetical protein